jgi:hypothetical protein
MRYFTCTASSCVSMWMSLARRWIAVKIVESTSLMTGLMSLVSRSTVRLSSPFSSSLSSCSWKPSVASSSTRCELSLFFRIDWIADGAPTVTLSGRREQRRQLVDHRQVGRVGDDDDERLALAAVRHEAVAQHQVGRDRPEQLVVDRNRSMSTNSRRYRSARCRRAPPRRGGRRLAGGIEARTPASACRAGPRGRRARVLLGTAMAIS